MAKSMTDYDFDICMIWDVPFDIKDYIADLEEDLNKEKFEGKILFDFRNLAESEDKRYVLGEFKDGKLSLPMEQLPDFEKFGWNDDYYEGDYYQEEADFLFEHYGKQKNLSSVKMHEQNQKQKPEVKQEEIPERKQEEDPLLYEQLKLF